MRLSEMLIYADIEQLSAIAKRYYCECNTNSKHALIQSILSHSYRDDIVQTQLNEMSNQQKHLLSLLLFQEAKKFSTEELKAKIKYCKFNDLEDVKPKSKKKTVVVTPVEERILKQMRDEGWLFKEQGITQQHSLYDIPEDKAEFFRKHLAQQIKDELTVYEQVTIVREESGLISEDSKLLLQFINQHQILLNDISLMGKRQLQQLLNSLYVNEPIPGKGAWKFGYGKKFGEYPDRLALLYEFTVHAGWIEEGETANLTATGLQKLSLPWTEEDSINIISYWLKIYKKPIPNLKAVTYLLMSALEQWRSVEELQYSLKPYITSYYFDNEEAILHKRILKMLLHFGVVMLGQTEKDSLLVKLTPYGKRWLEQALKMTNAGRYHRQV